MSFEEDVERLEAIAAELEGEGISLDRALKLFEEGVKRLRRATAELGRAETQVALLVEQVDGAFVLRPIRDDARASGSDSSGSAGRI
jgi:exodeoxyribonuclease VII small subunit